MVNALVRDSFFGQLVRLITNDRLLQYPEERDPSLWHTYINAEKSRNLALHGTPENHPLETAEHFLEHPNHEQSLTPEEIIAHDRGRITSSANILYRRTRRLRKITGRSNLRCEPELIAEQMTGKDVAIILARAFTLNFQEPIVFLLNLYIALIYGLLYVWFESFAIVFVEIYGFSLGMEGLSFIGILCGALIVLPPFCIYLYFVQEPQFDENGELKPEKRLPPAFVGAFCIPICLFWFGWTSRESIHWIVPIIGSSFFTIGAFLLFNSVLNYLGDAYPEYAASVFAGNDFMRSSFGAGFPLFAGAMYRNLGVGWASTLLALLSVVFIPIPFLLYKYGERLRHASKHARHDL